MTDKKKFDTADEIDDADLLVEGSDLADRTRMARDRAAIQGKTDVSGIGHAPATGPEVERHVAKEGELVHPARVETESGETAPPSFIDPARLVKPKDK